MIRNISADDLRKWIESGKSLGIVDVSNPGVCELEHIQGAICVPMNHLEEVRSRFELTRPLVVYCADNQCNSSLYAAEELQKMGFREVYELGGGLAAWRGKSEAKESTAPETRVSDI